MSETLVDIGVFALLGGIVTGVLAVFVGLYRLLTTYDTLLVLGSISVACLGIFATMFVLVEYVEI